MSLPSDSNNVSHKIEIWKAQYGLIFQIHIGAHDFIYRGLTIDEYRYLLTQKESEAAQDWVLERAILHPQDCLHELDDPQIIQLYNTIFQSTYFGDEEEINANVVRLREEYSTNLWKAVCIFILQTMPVYKISELENLTVDKLLDLYIVAELMRGEQMLAPEDKTRARKAGKKEPPAQRSILQDSPNQADEARAGDSLSQMSASKSHSELAATMAEHQAQAKKGLKPESTNPFKDNKAMDSYISSLNRE